MAIVHPFGSATRQMADPNPNVGSSQPFGEAKLQNNLAEWLKPL
jgi:hypothetical protein